MKPINQQYHNLDSTIEASYVDNHSGNTNERLQNEDRDATYAYVGYENTSDNSWYIYRRTRATNLREYATGASSYSTNWTNRGSLTYV